MKLSALGDLPGDNSVTCMRLGHGYKICDFLQEYKEQIINNFGWVGQNKHFIRPDIAL